MSLGRSPTNRRLGFGAVALVLDQALGNYPDVAVGVRVNDICIPNWSPRMADAHVRFGSTTEVTPIRLNVRSWG